MIRIVIPIHLRVLAGINGSEISLPVESPISITSILNALASKYPTLKGTIRDHDTFKRRPMIRFYACNEDLSHDPPDNTLPEKIVSGQEPLYIIAAIAGG